MPAYRLIVYRVAFYTVATIILLLATEPGDEAVDLFDWDKLDHAFAFLTLAGLLDFSYPNTPFRGLKWAALIGFGLFIECVQYLLPTRSFSLFDLLADAVGIGIYLLSRPVLRGIPFLSWRWSE